MPVLLGSKVRHGEFAVKDARQSAEQLLRFSGVALLQYPFDQYPSDQHVG